MAAREDLVKIVPFEMERMQSTWENQVEINLSESGVHPLTLGELLDDDGDRRRLLEIAPPKPPAISAAPEKVVPLARFLRPARQFALKLTSDTPDTKGENQA